MSLFFNILGFIAVHLLAAADCPGCRGVHPLVQSGLASAWRDGRDPRSDHDRHRPAGESASTLDSPATVGAVRFDLSIMLLLLVAFIGMQLAFDAAV